MASTKLMSLEIHSRPGKGWVKGMGEGEGEGVGVHRSGGGRGS